MEMHPGSSAGGLHPGGTFRYNVQLPRNEVSKIQLNKRNFKSTE